MDDNVVQIPIRSKEHSATLKLVRPFSGCQHERAVVDRRLAELECADCHAKLNPIEFLAGMAAKLTYWAYQFEELQKARVALAARRQCRCTKCGQITEIRRVGKREVARLKSSHQTEGK